MGREREREGEEHQCVVASHVPPTGDLAPNPGMCPREESHQWPCGSQASAQSAKPQPMLDQLFSLSVSCVLGGRLSLPGTQWLGYHLDCLCCLLEHKVNRLWSAGVRVGLICSSWNNSFSHSLTTRLINYYLKLKSSNSWLPHHFGHKYSLFKLDATIAIFLTLLFI